MEFPICLANIDRIVQAPDWIGQSPKQRDGFVMVRRIAIEKVIILIALKIQPDKQGRYAVASAYKLTQHDIDVRLKNGHLLPA